MRRVEDKGRPWWVLDHGLIALILAATIFEVRLREATGCNLQAWDLPDWVSAVLSGLVLIWIAVSVFAERSGREQ